MLPGGLHISSKVMYYYFLVKNIQKRIIAIIKSLPNRQRKQTVLTQKELKPKIDDLIADSKHILVPNQGRYQCQICNSSYSHTDKIFKEWVTSPCTEFANLAVFSHNRPEPYNNSFLHIGNQYVHHSHKLHMYKGLIYCGKCGYMKGANQVRKLAKPCGPPDIGGMWHQKPGSDPIW